MARKIDKMHELFGRGDGLCGKCTHFQRFHYHGRDYQKCEVYGISNSEATDWRQKWDGCGLFNKPYSGDVSIMKTIVPTKKWGKDAQINGQMSLFVGDENNADW